MTSLLAALGLTPADIASPLNSILLVAFLYVGSTIAREVRLLRDTILRDMANHHDETIKLVEGKIRVARGSEQRAEHAAAEITRLSEVMTRLAAHVDEVLMSLAADRRQEGPR